MTLYRTALIFATRHGIILVIAMKDGIHPIYHPSVSVTCACGNAFMVGSTAEKISVEICSNCHPFYTGKQKLVDVAGRVDKFRHRQEASVKLQIKTGKTAAHKVGATRKRQAKITKLG